MIGKLAFENSDVPITNLVNNGDFSRGTEGWGGQGLTIEVIDGELVGTSPGTSTISYLTHIVNMEASTHDTIYAKVRMRVISGEFSSYQLTIRKGNYSSLKTVAREYTNTEQTLSGVATLEEGDTSKIIIAPHGYFSELSKENKLAISYVVALNLTQTFGKGNEPTTEQMDHLMSQFPDSWFDGTQNIFNAQNFMGLRHKEFNELKRATMTLGGSD